MQARDDHEGRRGDDVPQDGLGRDAAHGDDHDVRYQGGSVGRSSRRAGDDDLPGPVDSAPPNAPRDAAIPHGTDEVGGGVTDTPTSGGARDGLDLAERDDVRRRDPTTR